MSYGLQPTTSSADTLLLPQDSNGVYRPSKTTISRGFQIKAINQRTHHTNGTSTPDNSSTSDTEKLVFTAQAPGRSEPPRQQPAGLSTRYVPYGVIDRDKSAKSAHVFPGPNEAVPSKGATTNATRTPERARNIVAAATDDQMDVDENSSATNGVLNGSPQKPADPSPGKSSVPEPPRERPKKKKKRSKLVDEQGL